MDNVPAGPIAGHMGSNAQPPANIPQPAGGNFTPSQMSSGVTAANFQPPPAYLQSRTEAAFQRTSEDGPPDAEEEIKRRADYMKKQRDLLVAKRKSEREKTTSRVPSSSAAGPNATNVNNNIGGSNPKTCGRQESELAQQLRRQQSEFKQQEEGQLHILREESDKQEKKKALMQQLRANLG